MASTQAVKEDQRRAERRARQRRGEQLRIANEAVVVLRSGQERRRDDRRSA